MTGRSLPRVVAVLSLLMMMVLSVFPAGSSLEVSDEVNITDNDDPEEAQRVDVDADGNYHVAYLRNDGGDYNKLMWMKVSPSGTVLKGPTQVSPGTVESGYSALAIAVDGSGRAHIAFAVQTSNDDARDLYYAQVGTDGGVTVSAKNVHSSSVTASALDIETDGAGNAYVVWNERSDPPTIEWMKVSPTGSVIKQAVEVSGELGFGGNLMYPRLGVSSSGFSYIAWQQEDNQVSPSSIYYSSLDPQGNVEVDPTEVSSNPALDLTLMEATANSRGDLYITYVENNAIEYVRVDDEGVAQEGSQFGKPFLGEASDPDVAVAPNDDVYFVYRERENMYNAPWHAYLRIYYDDNETWSDSVQVDEGTAGVLLVRVAATNTQAGVVLLRNGELYLVTVTPAAANRPPVASLSFSPADPSVGESVLFDGSDSTDPDSGDTVEEYYFEWGDGGNTGWTTSSSVSHAYTSAGTFTASLTVRDNHGLESETADRVTVTVSSTPVNRAPIAQLMASPLTVDLDQEVTFDGSSSTDPDGTVEEYRFDFGDGRSSGWVTTSMVTHAYTVEGVMYATLHVRDDEGKQSEEPSTVAVSVVHTNSPPTATIVSISPAEPMQGDEIIFTGTGVDEDGEVVTFEWSSNLDQVFASTEVARYKLSVGIHEITFRVRDDEGAWSEPATAQLTVRANTPFTLKDETKLPKDINTNTVVQFVVVYTDAEGDRPNTAKLLYSKGGDWKEEVLRESDPNDRDYTDGKEYYFKKKFSDDGKWQYSFEFRNDKNGKKSTLPVEFKVEKPPSLFPGLQAVPAAGALLVAAIVVSLLINRRQPAG